MREFWNSATGRRITVLVVLSILLTGFGTAGYMLLQDYSFVEALYMTVLTLSTVGFTEVHPLDTNGRIFTIILILMGVSFVAFSLAYFSQILLDGNLLATYRRRRLKKKLDQMENHYIVCGYGEMGQIIVGELFKHNVPVVIIEPDESALSRLREKNLLHLSGDATDEGNLISAGIHRAKGLVSVVTRDSENVFIVLTARDLNKELLIFARAGSAGTGKRLLKAGANRVVAPYAIGAARIAHNILRPTVTDFIELALSGEGMELGMEEIRIPENSKLVGMELMASGIRNNYDLIVMAIKRTEGKMVFNPPPQELFHDGDTLVVIGAVGNLSRFGRELYGSDYPAMSPSIS
ncbi:MAG: potassium channel family protein [Syntrophobacteraceae bacterium]